MLPHDATGQKGPKKHLPDNVNVFEPKEENLPITQPKPDVVPIVPVNA